MFFTLFASPVIWRYFWHYWNHQELFTMLDIFEIGTSLVLSTCIALFNAMEYWFHHYLMNTNFLWISLLFWCIFRCTCSVRNKNFFFLWLDQSPWSNISSKLIFTNSMRIGSTNSYETKVFLHFFLDIVPIFYYIRWLTI